MKSRKHALIDMVGTLLPSDLECDGAELNRLIASAVDVELTRDPTLAIDHVRRGLVETGWLIHDARSSRYRRSAQMGMLDAHRREVERWEGLIASAPDDYFGCPYCGERKKPAAQLNHYLKKHSLESAYGSAVREYGSVGLKLEVIGSV